MQSRFGVHVGAAGPGDPNALSGGRAPRRGSGSVRVRQALETSLGRLKDWMFSPLRFSATSKFVASGLVIGLGFIGLAGLFKPHHPVLAIVFIMGFLLTLGIVSMRLACGAFAAGDPSQFQRTQATARESADLRYLDRAIESATHGANVAEIGEQLGLVRRWMESHGVDGRRSPPIGLWNLVHLERLVIRLWLHPKLLLDFRQDLDFVFGTLTTRLFFGRPLNPASARASEKSA
jgi:hypothetical protein